MLTVRGHEKDLRPVALCESTRHDEPQVGCREPPCAAVLLVRMGSDQSDTLDRVEIRPWRRTIQFEGGGKQLDVQIGTPRAVKSRYVGLLLQNMAAKSNTRKRALWMMPAAHGN